MTSASVPCSALGSLDDPSELDPIRGVRRALQREAPGDWLGVLYPDAGEAVAVRMAGSGRARRARTQRDTPSARARRRMRRYSLSNDCRRLLTLTFATATHDRGQVRRVLKRALREVRIELGRAFAYVRVIEHHPEGHGLHIHLLVGSKAARLIAEKWRHGESDLRRLRSRRDVARATTYLTKEFERSEGGRHRYEIAQGFEPQRVELSASSCGALVSAFVEEMGGRPVLERVLGGPVPFAWVGWWATDALGSP